MSSKLRLLFVSHSFPPEGRESSNLGGMQRVATELHAAFVEHPEVELSTIILRSTARWNAAKMFYFLPQAFWRIRRMVRRGEVDVVLFSSLLTATLCPLLKRTLERSQTSALAIAHGDDVIGAVWAYQKVVPRVLKALDAVLPVSEATKQACLDRGAAEQQVFVVPNGVDPSRFDNQSKPTRTLPENALLICGVGRHVERKGFAWFVEQVMPRLSGNVHFWLVGEGPETEKIRALIGEKGLENRTRLLGRISDEELAATYSAADLMIMPNLDLPGTMEGFGVVILEAGLCRTPTIAARLEGMQDVIADDQNGYLLESENADAFVERIESLNENRNLLSELARKTEAYTERFTWAHIVQRHLDAIHGLIAARPTDSRSA